MMYDGGTGEDGGSSPRRSRLVTVLAILGVVMVVFLILYVPMRLTSTDAFCSSCHEMDAVHTSWEQSPHSNVSCVECHIEPGLRHAVRWRTREWINIWASWLNVDKVSMAQSRPSNANCLACHDVSRLSTQQADVRMPHELHVNMRNLDCIDCHDKVAHTSEGGTYGVSMSICQMCHSRAGTAPSDCAFCHARPPAPSKHPADFIEKHGPRAVANEPECLRCHHDKVNFCDECHSRPTPDHFAADWRYSHGPTATEDRAGCLGCHDEATFCNQCHRVSHPDDWVDTHADVATPGAGSCLTCHPQNMCVRCHAKENVVMP